jgi:surface-anchored protein
MENSWEVTPALPDNVYSWRVMARDNAGNEGQWSTVRRFRVLATRPVAPTPLSPANGSWTEDNRPTLRWAAVSDPTGIKYVLQVDNDNAFSPPVYENDNLTENSYRLPVGLHEGIYYWRVKAVSGTGLESDWSEVWKFGVDNSIPPPPVIVSPAVGENLNDNRPLLVWQRVTDVSGVRYDVQVDNDNDFSSPAVRENLIENENIRVALGLSDGRWYWRVRAVDGAGHASNWSSSWFVTDTVPPTVTLTQTPQSPTGQTTLSYAGTATDATTNVVLVEYRINQGNWVSVSGITPAKTVSFSFTIENVAPGQYTVEVRAKDAAGNVSTPASHSVAVTGGDFTLSVSPTTVSVKQGENAQVTITVTSVGGFSQQVTLSVSGLPGGTTYTLSPSSGVPNFTSTLTISTGPASEPGTYTVTVTATGGGKTHMQTFTLTVTVPSAPGPAISWTLLGAIVVVIGVIVIILKFVLW